MRVVRPLLTAFRPRFLCYGAVGLKFLPIWTVTTPGQASAAFDLTQFPLRSLFWTAFETAKQTLAQRHIEKPHPVTELLPLVFVQGQMSGFHFDLSTALGSSNLHRMKVAREATSSNSIDTPAKRWRATFQDDSTPHPTKPPPACTARSSSFDVPAVLPENPKEWKVAQVLQWLQKLDFDDEDTRKDVGKQLESERNSQFLAQY